MNAIQHSIDRLAAPLVNTNRIWLFKKVAYLWMLLNALYYLPVAEVFFGTEKLMMPYAAQPGLLNNITHLLAMNPEYGRLVYFGYIGAAFFSLIGIGWRIPRLFVFILGWMLYYGSLPTFNSALLLYQVFAFFLIFMGNGNATGSNAVLTRLSFVACQIQFLIVYLLAGGYKLAGQTWIEGSSLHFALHLDHFVTTAMRDALIGFEWPLRVLTIVGMTYQLVFPFLIWFKKLKWPLFAIGILFHGFIMVAMRLPDFGLAMIFGYTLFFTEAHSRNIRERLTSIF